MTSDQFHGTHRPGVLLTVLQVGPFNSLLFAFGLNEISGCACERKSVCMAVCSFLAHTVDWMGSVETDMPHNPNL